MAVGHLRGGMMIEARGARPCQFWQAFENSCDPTNQRPDNGRVTNTVMTDAQIEAALLTIVRQRGPLSSACPSEAARALSPQNWRILMPRVRDVASLLAQSGLLDVSQRGKSLPPQGPWKGPIRVRMPRPKP